MYPKGKADSVGRDYFPKSTTPNHLPHPSGLGLMAHEEDTCQTNVRSSQSRCVATTGPQLTPKLPRSGGHLSKPANNSTKLTARQCSFLPNWRKPTGKDRKSTRLNSSHVAISYAVFCLKN